MPITFDQIIEEVRQWPPERVGELVGRLTDDLHASDPETEAAWKAEINRRVEEIQTGKVQGILGSARSRLDRSCDACKTSPRLLDRAYRIKAEAPPRVR